MTVLRVSRGDPRTVLRVVAVDGGGGGDPPDPGGGEFEPIEPVLKSSSPPAITFVLFPVQQDQRVENTSYLLRARLNRPTFEPAVVPIKVTVNTTVASSQYTLSADRFEFAATTDEAEIQVTLGADAAAGDTEVLELELDPDPNIIYMDEQGDPYRILPQAGVSNVYTCTVTNEVAPPTPSWTFPGATTTVSELAGTVQVPIALDAPATDEVRIRVQTSNNSAVQGRDYVAVDEEVVIAAGAKGGAFDLTILQNGLFFPSNLRFDVAGTIVAGNVQDGANTSFQVIIDEADQPGGNDPPTVSWAVSADSIFEGETSISYICALRDPDGNLTFAPTLFDVPVTVGGTATEGDDFEVNWGSNPVGFLRFPAGTAVARVSITSIADVTPDSGETVELRVEDPPSGDDWQTSPSTNRLTITLLDPVEATTDLLLPSHATAGLRMVQGIVAVNPPQAQLPDYKLSTGERVQVVGHRRNADDEWTAVYVYGLVDEAESVPGTAGAKAIDYGDTSDPLPMNSGAFEDSLELMFDCTLANVAGDFAASTDPGSSPSTILQDEVFTGPGGRFEQRGADIVRQRVIRMQFAAPGTSGGTAPRTSGGVAGTGAMYLELCETRIAGESGVVLYEGRFGPIGWQSDYNFQKGFASSFNDGEAHVGRLRVTAPEGYTIEMIDEHPRQRNSGNRTAELLEQRGSGGQPYWFGAGDSYPFWFAVCNDEDVDAVQKATDYIRCRNIFWAVGTLGATENAIYNEAPSKSVDFAKWQFADPWSSTSGWASVLAIGDERQANAISDWTAGSWQGTTRWGRFVGDSLTGGGAPGGTGIYGPLGWYPASGYWYRRRIDNVIGISRIPCARSLEAGEPPWWWNYQTTVGGEARAWQVLTPIDRRSGHRIYQQWDHRIRQLPFEYYVGQSPGNSPQKAIVNSFAGAAETKPWNRGIVRDTLTLDTLLQTGSPTPDGRASELRVTTTIPPGTPLQGVLYVARGDGTYRVAPYSTWSGDTFTLASAAGRDDWWELADWSGADVVTTDSDPDVPSITQYDVWFWTHMARCRQSYVDQWIGMRSFLGWSLWQDCAARVTTTWHPLKPAENIDGFEIRNACIAAIFEEDQRWPGYAQTGVQVISMDRFGNTYQNVNQNNASDNPPTRAVGWAMMCVAGFYQFADTATRLELRGVGAVTSGQSGGNFMAAFLAYFNYRTAPDGVHGHRYNDGNPNPWNANVAGPPDFGTHTGAIPLGVQGSSDGGCGTKNFQQSYAVVGYAAMRAAYNSPLHTSLTRVLNWYVTSYRAARNFTQANGEAIESDIALSGLSLYPDKGIVPTTPTVVSTLAEAEAGDAWWWQPLSVNVRQKFLWSIVSAFAVGADDSESFDIAKRYYDRQQLSDQEFVDYLRDRLLAEFNGPNANERVGELGEYSFWWSFVAELLTRF